ncbi:carbonic anhydrase [Achlya hypogyna]|uniref:carbonic anhydrase n=1 Tax=Achlya hypogyna TaxID=1202772 RepID=A0A1V9Z7F3_ACHHY|nr:carbonic anhydrase [Achlya hypogyna]
MSQQSPIDIIPTIAKEVDNHVELEVGCACGEIEHGGSNFKVHWKGGNNSTLVLNGVTYRPIQFHFHTPSEHTIEGKAYPFVMHLVHQSEDGKLAVVAIFFDEGDESTFLAQVWEHLGKVEPHGDRVAVDAISFESLDINAESYFRYTGSLTTPPYTEGVEWVIVKDPRQISPEQIAEFVKVIPGDTNARDLQPVVSGKLLFCCEN